MQLSVRTRDRLVLVLGVLIAAEAVAGTYLIMTGRETMATTTFSTMAALAASMAAISDQRGDGEAEGSDGRQG